MFRRFSSAQSLFAIPAFALALSMSASAQTPALITQPIDNNSLVTLVGNTRPEANAADDLGPVSDAFTMDHMLLQLQRSPQQEAALDQFIQQLNQPSSPNYHHWLTPAQFGSKFGLAQSDLNTIAQWLQSQGFTVNTVYPSGILIDFSGTAGQVRTAFHTEIHNLNVKGAAHIANMRDPRIPAALAPAVAGIVSLHDFMPHPAYVKRPSYTIGNDYYLLVPQDLATIYNFNPLFSSKVTGAGQTIVVIEDTDVYSTADWSTFRTTFGLSRFPSGSFTEVHPPSTGTNNCADPGVLVGNDFEAILDAEYASAGAPGAAIQLASCKDTTTTFGGLIALNNLVNASTPPPVVSISYAECESLNGAASNAAFKSVYSHAATEGVSVFVAAGDWGGDVCGASLGQSTAATTGISVSAFASTPYNVAVGGTDFEDFFQNDQSTYWSSTNSQYYGSAKSYVPEIPWNDTCGSGLTANYLGFSTTYGSSGLCNSSTDVFLGIIAGSGGPSACATGSSTTTGVSNGTCKGYAKPSWQAVYGNPADGVRDLPDVSLFASNGFLGHYYVVCYSDTAGGGAPCTGVPSGWPGGGGTSFASPIMAGVQALVNQKTGARQGLPNAALYQLAAAEYGASGNSACNASKGNGTSSTCTFYDMTQGNMDIPCTGTYNCYDPSGTYGVLSSSDSAYKPSFPAASGWDFATGLGSVNVTNLVNNWSTVAP